MLAPTCIDASSEACKSALWSVQCAMCMEFSVGEKRSDDNLHPAPLEDSVAKHQNWSRVDLVALDVPGSSSSIDARSS